MNKILNYTVQGSGPPVLLLHGILGSGSYWDGVVENLKNNCQIITIDLLGFGDSPKPKDLAYTVADHLRYIVATLETISVQKPITVVGHSMGAILGLSLAKSYPKYVKNLVLISLPVYQNPEEAKEIITASKIVPKLMYYGLTARVACAVMCQFRPLAQRLVPYFFKHVPKQVAIDSTKHTWYSYSRSMAHVIENQDSITDLRELVVPAVLIYGRNDKFAGPSTINTLQHKISTIKIMKLNGTHHIPIEQPETIARLISESLQATN
jgi:pimeloyl-ACP methyl ester carboxylesterase